MLYPLSYEGGLDFFEALRAIRVLRGTTSLARPC